MLPGFRFLFAAIILSMSILVFGLGAAALLRAAHEEFASNPAWHAASRETAFAQRGEAARDAAREAARDTARESARPVLAMLRLDAPAAEQSAVEKPVIEKPSEDAAAAAAAEPGDPQKIAALKPEASSLPEPAKSEIPVSERPAPSASQAQTESPEKSEADTPAPAGETPMAATEKTLPPSNDAAAAAAAVPTASEQTERANPAATPDTDVAFAKIAMLGSPPVTIEVQPSAKAAAAANDASILKKRQRARRAAQRRRIAARARLALEQAFLQQQQQQLLANPFAPRPLR